jgi:hypothetical protein
MPRVRRRFLVDPTELGVYHCINRCVRRSFLCGKDPLSGKDYETEKVSGTYIDKKRCRLLWSWHGKTTASRRGGLRLSHLEPRERADEDVWPREDGELSQFIGWLTLTHTQRWHAHRHSAGSGHLYQGRFKSFPIEEDDHLYTVNRYVERNARRANLVRRAEQWRWGSLFRWLRNSAEDWRLLSAWHVYHV